MSLDNPIGIGTNNFEYIHPKYANAGVKGKKSPFVNAKQILRTPHNYPLKVFSEIGLLGGGLTLLMYLIVFYYGLRNAYSGTFFDKWALVSLVAVLFHSLVSGVFLNPVSLFFSACLFSTILKKNKTHKNWQIPIPFPPIKKIAVAQIVFVPIMSSMWLTSNLYAFQGVRNFDPDRLKQSLILNPGNERAWYDLSRIQYQKYRDLEGSLSSINQFISLYPYHIKGLYIKAQREIELQKYNQAKYTIDRLLGTYPNYQKAKLLKQRLKKLSNN